MGEKYMESVNFQDNFMEVSDNNLDKETLIGWSTACLNETISFYVDCNFNNINNEETYES
uniref:Uncharacterized protein n=1 Tax=Kumanoa americana TaxID=1196377 RepID=A0A1C9CGI4_9FLOR|nr:hypothetical protein Kuma_062 [Kumanoa americana]AOM67496.1 hypothetical protein Kuma_062 [Kumanoa americana]